ncbi:hypothetical protein AZE42_05998 [Rhizopogon vesiculosus]|uniref:F-box domain-containing protein n=1 Tax=Rhizopogon vesiculosus TaxID=180088 RepID=A0A1J8Q6H5_9AGAM|nr:hypothetical protein AZE42_05998 [Rhizopogon vesiculosus]
MRDYFSLDQLDRRSLAALCRVCHSFKDVALDMLWAELEDLHPLFPVFHEIYGLALEIHSYTLRRPVTIVEWSIFEQYASRVRVLGDGSSIFGDLEAEFVHTIMGLTSKLLLPNLRELCCGDCDPDLHACVRYFLSPVLISFQVSASARPD